jgi:hypothetical protein
MAAPAVLSIRRFMARTILKRPLAAMLIPERFMKHRHGTRSVDPIVRWEFERDHRHLLCAILVTPTASSDEVATVPLSNGGRTAVETFESPSAALHRLAVIAADLRATGWTIAAYTT